MTKVPASLKREQEVIMNDSMPVSLKFWWNGQIPWELQVTKNHRRNTNLNSSVFILKIEFTIKKSSPFPLLPPPRKTGPVGFTG